jgi:hypothetical protein
MHACMHRARTAQQCSGRRGGALHAGGGGPRPSGDARVWPSQGLMQRRRRQWGFLVLFCSLASATYPRRAIASCEHWQPGEAPAAWTCHQHPSNDDCADSAKNTLSIMADENQKIGYSGTLSSWGYYAYRAGKTTLQIWRPTASTNGFKLICATEIDSPGIGVHHVDVPPDQPSCEVKAGDFFGMWQAGEGVLGIRWSDLYP